MAIDRGRRFGGCVRIHERWILTAHHVVDVPDLARRFTVTFNDAHSATVGPFHYRLDPDLGFYPSGDGIQGHSGETWDLDYVFIALAEEANPALGASANVARIRVQPPVAGDLAQIVQYGSRTAPLKLPLEQVNEHPDAGRVKHVDDDYLYYRTSTQPGTSGSPVFDQDWNVVGLHTMAYRPGHEDPWRRFCNSGTLIGRILENVRTRHPGFPVDDLVTLAQPGQSPGAQTPPASDAHPVQAGDPA